MPVRGNLPGIFGNMFKLPPRLPDDTAESADAGVTAPGAPFEPSVADVLVTKAMLTKALSLPREIIDTIVDFAEYWPHTTTERTDDGSDMVARGAAGANENLFLLRCPPLGLHSWKRVAHGTDNEAVEKKPPKPRPAGEEYSADDFQELIASPISLLAHPCRRIVFTIKSRDQGWGGMFADHGTYRGSWTWFEAGLERWCKSGPAGQQTQQEHEKPSLNPDDLCTVIPTVRPRAAEEGYTFGHPLHAAHDLKIQCNVTAGKEAKEHRVVWSYTDDIDPDRDVEEAEKLAEQGRGRATGNGRFVRDLKLGDVVTVWAKARFPSWINFVESVKVDVYYAI